MSTGFVGFIAIVAIINCIAFSAWRLSFVYVDRAVFRGFCTHLWSLAVLNALFLMHIWCKLLLHGGGVPVWQVAACGTVTCLITLTSGAFLLFGRKRGLADYYYTSLDTAPFFLIFFGLLFLCYIAPSLGEIWGAVINAVAAIGIVLTLIFKVLPLKKLRFLTSPIVFDTGNGYTVVIGTSVKTAAKLTYEYENRHFECFDSFHGEKEVSRVHGIFVPYEHLNCNGYTVSASRVVDRPAYGGRLGDTIERNVTVFNESYSDAPNLLVISGWYGNDVDWGAIKRRHENNALLVLGNTVHGLYTESSAVKSFLKPCSVFSEGKIPVFFAPGSAEHHGAYVRELFTRLGLEQAYYRFSIGEYNFTVIDSGEDSPDGDFQNAGFSDGEKYLERQLAWLRDEAVPEEGYNTVISNSPDIMDIGGFGETAAELLRERGHSFLICGGRPVCSYTAADAETNTTGIDTYAAGGFTKKNGFVYSLIRFSEGVASISAYSENGDCVAQYDEKLVHDRGAPLR